MSSDKLYKLKMLDAVYICKSIYNGLMSDLYIHIPKEHFEACVI